MFRKCPITLKEGPTVIKNPSLYVLSLPLDGPAKGILSGITSIRLRGGHAQPGYLELARWISRSTKTVARALQELEAKGYLKRKRRGKKLTNVYFLGHFLYRLLTAGRRILSRHEERSAQEPLSPERAHELFAELYRAKPS